MGHGNVEITEQNQTPIIERRRNDDGTTQATIEMANRDIADDIALKLEIRPAHRSSQHLSQDRDEQAKIREVGAAGQV